MRIFFNQSVRSIFIESVGRYFRPEELSASIAGNKINIFTAAGETKVAALDYTNVERENGSGFIDAASALSYIEGELANPSFDETDNINGGNF